MKSALALSLCSLGGAAHAGGMLMPVHGVHSVERAGALVAGADDAEALWLDPAGLARAAGDGKTSLLFDIAYAYQSVAFTPPGDATATNQQPGAAVPSLAGALGIGDRLVIAGGLASPALGSSRYTDDSIARYASLGWSGTQIVVVAIGAAYAVTPQLRVGATVQDVVSSLKLSLVASGCPGAMTCAPADRSFDLPLAIAQNDYLAPSGSLGVQYDATDAVTLGATLQAPARISSAGTLTVTPPTNTAFTGMQVTGDRATTSFTLPPSARIGAELHRDAVRVEAALAIELWSVHDAITIEPDNVKVGTLALQPMRIARDYGTSIAASLGGEVELGVVQLGAGLGYETAAAPNGTVSVLTVDANKLLLGIGGGYAANGWQLGVAFGLAKLFDTTVTDAKVAELAPLHDAGTAPAFVNAGTYHSTYVLAGLRAARTF